MDACVRLTHTHIYAYICNVCAHIYYYYMCMHHKLHITRASCFAAEAPKLYMHRCKLYSSVEILGREAMRNAIYCNSACYVLCSIYRHPHGFNMLIYPPMRFLHGCFCIIVAGIAAGLGTVLHPVRKLRTAVRHRSSSPHWDEDMTFPVRMNQGMRAVCVVWDWGNFQ